MGAVSTACRFNEARIYMRGKVDEHKKLLAYYEARKDLIRKQAQDLINHCQGLIRIYGQAATENLNMAKSHRELAAAAK